MKRNGADRKLVQTGRETTTARSSEAGERFVPLPKSHLSIMTVSRPKSTRDITVARGGVTMRRSLPLNPTLEVIESEARQLLHEVCRGNSAAAGRWYSLDSEAHGFKPRRADIQYVIAREYGFKSWESLKARLNHVSQ